MRHIVSLLLVLAAPCRGEAPAPTMSKGAVMQYGPILSCTVEAPLPEPERAVDKANRPTAPAPPSPNALKRIVARKGIVIKLGAGDEGYVCFDTDTLRMAAGWTDGFLDLSETNIGTYKGNRTGAGVIAGNITFKTADGPGWSIDGKFDDPRENKVGRMPAGYGRYRGLYLRDDRVLLNYEVTGCNIFEMAQLIRRGDRPVLIRWLTIGPSTRTLHLRLLDRARSEESNAPRRPVDDFQTMDGADLVVLASHSDLNGCGMCATASGQAVELVIPSHGSDANIGVAIWRGDKGAAPVDLQHTLLGGRDLGALRNPGDLRWRQTFSLPGQVASPDKAYVVDTIPVPEENPWKSWMRISAFDFFEDGRAAVATLNGDVWLVSGLDEKLEHITWKRFAVGFYEPLGVKVVDGKVHVHGRDQITRLHDLNGDGEADFYECFNSDRTIYPSYHAYAYDLQTDGAGNFYYVVGGAWLGKERPWHACLVKLSADGRRSETVATGFRAPNGMAIGPHDEITVSDNQGNWTPASKISLVRPGGFYGFVADPRVEPDAKGPDTFDQPLCWIPQTLDNSSGGQVWAPASWGPFGGKLLHTSYGAAALFAVLDERLEGVGQGGVVKFPLKFDSGIMRARFGPHDGQLYVAGLRGWQTAGSKDGCLQRVRHTGLPSYLPSDLHIKKDAIAITFAEALQPESAADPQNFAIQQWNYRWSSTYGSPDFSVARPDVQGRDEVEIAAAEVSQDRKTVRLLVPGLKPVMQMLIKLNIIAADGTPIHAEIANTIHRVPAG